MTIAARIAAFGLMVAQTSMAAPNLSIPVTAPGIGTKEIQRVEPKLPVRHPKVIAPQVMTMASGKVASTYIPINGFDDLFGGWENFGVAVAPDRIELVRLRQVKKDALAPGDFVEEGATELSIEDATELRVALTSDSTYNWEEDYECAPAYAFRVKFRQDKKLVCVDLGFACRTLRVVKDGREIASKNFEFGYDALAAVVERKFPGVLDDLPHEEQLFSYSARRPVPPKESEILTGQKVERLIASADKVLISAEDTPADRNRFVTDLDWIHRLAAAMGATQLSRSTHCFCVGWKTATFYCNGEPVLTIAPIHGNQLRIYSKIASGDYPIDETQWKVVAKVFDEQQLAHPTPAGQ